MEKQVAILIADLSGFTALTEFHGARAAADIVNQFEKAAIASLKGESFLFKKVGDQVIIMSNTADDIARTALQLQLHTREISQFLAIHAGLHYGTVLQKDNDYYGSGINITARITAKAAGGVLLASSDFVEALSEPGLFRFNLFGDIRLKNVFNTIRLLKLVQDESPRYVDPVCRMHLSHSDVKHVIRHDDGIFYFCSDECLNVFEKNKNEWLMRDSIVVENHK